MSTVITILTTNDAHGRFLSEDGPEILNYAKLSTYKKSLENCLLVDAGDATQGTPMAVYKKGLYPVQLMNTVGYDALTIGNHEFDNISKDTDDTHELNEIIAESQMPYICANVMWKQADGNRQNYIRHVYQEKKITDRGNGRYFYKKISEKHLLFIGVCTPMISMSISRMRDFEINKQDVAKEIKSAIADAKSEYGRNRFDAVILLAHIGRSTTGYSTDDLIKELTLDLVRSENISLIIDGHSHEKYSETEKDTGIVCFQADCYSKYFGEITLEFDDSNKLTIKTAFRTNSELNHYHEDEKVLERLNVIRKEINKAFGTVYASGSNMTLWGGAINEEKPYAPKMLEALNITRYVHTNFGRLTAEAMIHSVRVHHSDRIIEGDYIVAGINGGGVRDSIPFGEPLTGNKLYYALPSLLGSEKESGFVLFRITIEQLKKVLDNSISGLRYNAGQITSGSGGFLNTGGIRYTVRYDSQSRKMVLDDRALLTCGKTVGIALKEIHFSKDKDKTVLMCITKYLANGGDGYDFEDAKVEYKEDSAIFKITGEYIQHLSGSAAGREKPLFYPAVSQDIQYSGFDFTTPKQITITLKDKNNKLLRNQGVIYCFADEKTFKNYKVANTNGNGEFSAIPQEGPSIMCIGALLGVASSGETYLYGEAFFHSYFSMRGKDKFQCQVYPRNSTGYVLLDTNNVSEFSHTGISKTSHHHSNYIKYYDENHNEKTFTIIGNQFYLWGRDCIIHQAEDIIYVDANRNIKRMKSIFPKEGISYLCWDSNTYFSKLKHSNVLDISELRGGIGNEVSTHFDGCLFAKNHCMNITGFQIRSGEILDGIGFIYGDNSKFFFGNPAGGSETIVRFKEGEYIEKITGAVKDVYYCCVTNLTIYTNKTKYGPFGGDTGVDAFEISKKGYKICALLGDEAVPDSWGRKVVRKIGVMFMPIEC